jgi:hypothetical protein
VAFSLPLHYRFRYQYKELHMTDTDITPAEARQLDLEAEMRSLGAAFGIETASYTQGVIHAQNNQRH